MQSRGQKTSQKHEYLFPMVFGLGGPTQTLIGLKVIYLTECNVLK